MNKTETKTGEVERFVKLRESLWS